MANPIQSPLRYEDPVLEPRRPGEPTPAGRLRRWHARLTAFGWYAIIVIILAPYPFKSLYPTEEGVEVQQTIHAIRPIELVDQVATNQAIAEAHQRRVQVWVRRVNAEERMLQRLQILTEELARARPQEPEAIRQFTARMAETHNIVVSNATIQQLTPPMLERRTHLPMSMERLQRELRLILETLIEHRGIVTNLSSYRAHSAGGVLDVRLAAEIDRRALEAPSVAEPPDPDRVLEWLFAPQGSAVPTRYVREFLDRELLPRHFGSAENTADLRRAVLDLLLQVLEPNIVHSAEASNWLARLKERELTRNPVVAFFPAGGVIVHAGETLTAVQARALEELNLLRWRMDSFKLLGVMLLTGIFFIAVLIYLQRFRRDMTLDASTITLHVLPALVVLLIGEAMVWRELEPLMVMIWFPAALVGMLSSLLIAPQVAFVLVLAASCLFGVAAGFELEFLIYALFGGFAGVLASRNVRGRIDILRAGIKVGLVNVLTLMVLALADPHWLVPDGYDSILAMLNEIDQLMLFGFLNGLAAALATLILLVVFEWAFGIVTDLRLLELTGLKHPLVRQLEMKSPGTYQHTLNVSKLAEAAAEAIGANTLLVRAGTYFHDIGKLVKPKYFSENQVTLDDKKAHSRLSPYMSVLIIKNHVKEGVELARQYKLPEKIVDFIPQHHGTGLIRYFYQEAVRRYEESETVDPVREDDFRYPGPKPQSVEAAILLLADSVEAIASSRFTGGQVSESELRRTVQNAITERFRDGQFDECNLTMRHLQQIREALVGALMARYHFRISYPTPPKPRDAQREAYQTSINVAGPAGS